MLTLKKQLWHFLRSITRLRVYSAVTPVLLSFRAPGRSQFLWPRCTQLALSPRLTMGGWESRPPPPTPGTAGSAWADISIHHCSSWLFTPRSQPRRPPKGTAGAPRPAGVLPPPHRHPHRSRGIPRSQPPGARTLQDPARPTAPRRAGPAHRPR